MFENICLNCFKDNGGYDVCPHCGFVKGTLPEQEYHLYPGTMLNDRYIIGTVIGFGGFGITYKAWDTKLGSVVAVKEYYSSGIANRVPGEKVVNVFDDSEQTNYKEGLDRFIEEAKNLAQFNGKANIVNVFGFFEENNTAYIVMEYLDGISLKAYIEENGKIPVDTALVIITDLLNGMAEVHAKGILHRDIAPDNIMMTNEGVVKILDFGSARFSSEHSEKTLSAFIKPGYAAPEQYAAQGKHGAYTDIYGLGATMYHMVTGVKPEESTDRLVNDTVAKPSDLGIDIPIEVDKSIMKAISLQIEFRFKNTDEFLAALSGEYPIEYPEIEIKKRKIKRRIISAACIFCFLCAIGSVVFLYNYFQTDAYEQIVDGTKLDVWVYVENSSYDPTMSSAPDTFKEAVAENNAERIEKQEENFKNLEENFKSNMSDNYKGKQVDVEIKMFSDKQEYDEALMEAYSSDSLPDVFMISGKYDEIKDKCKDLTDFASIFADGNYNYISESNYSEIYPDKKVIPTGINAPVLYVNNSLISDYDISDEMNKEKFVSLDELTAFDEFAGEEKATSISQGALWKSKMWGIDKEAFAEFAALFADELSNGDGSANSSQENADLIKALHESYEKNGFADSYNEDVYEYRGPLLYFYHGQLTYLVGDTSSFDSINNYLGGRL